MHARRLIARAAALALASGLAVSGFTGTAVGVDVARGQKVAVDDVLLIMDASSSLGSDFEGQQRLAKSFAAGMPKGSYEVSTLVFGGGERETTDLAPFNRSGVEQAVSVDKVGRGTPLTDVLGEARSTLSQAQGQVAVVIFSDGLPTVGGRNEPTGHALTAARRLANDHPDRICIHTVQSGDSRLGASLMRQLSEVTECGTYRKATALGSASALSTYQQAIFLEGDALPAVSAAPPHMAISDFDGDGVADARDLCAGTAKGAAVDSSGCPIIQSVHFGTGSAQIGQESQQGLNLAAAALAQNDSLRVRLAGHASATGTPEINARMSERRAEAVRNRLVAAGIDASRIEVASYGSKQPVSGNDTPQGRKQNQRVEVQFVTQ